MQWEGRSVWEIPEQAGTHDLPAGKGRIRTDKSAENTAGYPEASVIEVAGAVNRRGVGVGQQGLWREGTLWNSHDTDPTAAASSEPRAGSGNLTGPS